jgi:hypothetical protein
MTQSAFPVFDNGQQVCALTLSDINREPNRPAFADAERDVSGIVATIHAIRRANTLAREA